MLSQIRQIQTRSLSNDIERDETCTDEANELLGNHNVISDSTEIETRILSSYSERDETDDAIKLLGSHIVISNLKKLHT